MTTATEIRHAPATGTWQLDPVHSSVNFEISYLSGTFRGQFREIDAKLTVEGAGLSRLEGTAQVASVDVKDENLAAHLQSPEFFDAARYPELRFAADGFELDGESVAVDGELTIRGVTLPIELTGRLTPSLTDPYGRARLGLALSASVDRTNFGLNWNLPLPTGEPALANEVSILAELFLVQEA